MDGILAKPLFSDTLLREIHNVLIRRSGDEPVVEPEAEQGSALAGRRVLMAEDVEQNAEILEDLLDLEDVLHAHAVKRGTAVKMFSRVP